MKKWEENDKMMRLKGLAECRGGEYSEVRRRFRNVAEIVLIWNVAFCKFHILLFNYEIMKIYLDVLTILTVQNWKMKVKFFRDSYLILWFSALSHFSRLAFADFDNIIFEKL